MIYERRVIVVFLLCLAVALAARAQADPCQQRTVIASVVNDQALPVQGLTADNFSARFKGKEVKILSAQLDDQPHRVVVVLDSSGSMFSPESQWNLAKSLALDAVTASPARFRAGLIVFNNQIRVRLPIQESTQSAREALNALVPPHRKSDKSTGGTTALLDALMAATQMFEPPQFGDSIYAITDGSDNHSKATEEEVRAALAKRGIRLFVQIVGVGTGQRTTPEEVSGPHELEELVEDSGGRMLLVSPVSIFGKGLPDQYYPKRETLKPFQVAELYLYSLIQFAYRLEIALPASTHKSDKWNLTVLPPKDLHARWLVNYPKRLDSCAEAASAAR